MNSESPRLKFLVLPDLLAVVAGYWIAAMVRFGTEMEQWSAGTLVPILFLLLLYLVIFLTDARSDADFMGRGLTRELAVTVKRTVLLFLLFIAGVFLVQETQTYSRLFYVYDAGLTAALMYVLRLIEKKLMRHYDSKSSSTPRLVIMTTSSRVDELAKMLADPTGNMSGYRMAGWILVDEGSEVIGRTLNGYPVIGNYDTMYGCVTNSVADEIYINIPYGNGMHVAKVIEQYEDMGITVNLNVNVFDLKLRHRQRELRQMGDYYVVSFRQTVVTPQMLFIKRVMDIAGGLVGILITAVVTVFVAPPLLIESPGPLFFSQVRVGKNGRRFKIYKFRSMYRDAEERKKELMAQNEMKGLMFKMENDPRITKVGHFIRKYSIDELPQFWNVLKGDMSLVGTRPPTLDEFLQYEPRYKRRLSIKPGITGMWQASGRSNIKDFEDVLALDLEYIDNWSLSLDIKILFKTVYVAVFAKGAS